MAAGDVQTITTGADLGARVNQIASDFNAVFGAGTARHRLFDVFRDVGKISERQGNTLIVRFLYEIIDAATPPIDGGNRFLMQAFEGAGDDVQTDYETFFSSNPTFIPFRIIDLTDIEAGAVQPVRLVVIYIDTDDNPLGLFAFNQVLIGAPTANVAPLATGTFTIFDEDGATATTVTARNMSTADIWDLGETSYLIFDPNTNEIVGLPSCCGVP